MIDILSNESSAHNNLVPKLKLSDLKNNNEQLRKPKKDLEAMAVAYQQALD
jgi:hypothetical protein